jgi:hypothetical protein
MRSPVFSVGALVGVPAVDAFAFLADGMNQIHMIKGRLERGFR